MVETNIGSQTSTVQKRIKTCAKKTCSVKTLKKRLPILEWLPKYSLGYLIQDIIAGITVGLTAIPQGIAYAVIAGLSPEYGLYASLTSGFVYVVFGSCGNVTVGPTAILSAMVAKYVANYSPDFAILAAFLSGVIILVMGLLHLGFLVEFISQPVISGFTTAAALQIAAAQLKSTFGLEGSSGNFFAESVNNFIVNIKTAKLWETVLTFSTIAMLLILQRLGKGCKRTDSCVRQMRWFISLARNAVVVVLGMILAYILKVTTDSEPISIIGEIGSGLPQIKPPPFSTETNNGTLSFIEMVQILGAQAVILPFVAILESVAIAKAFAGGVPIDATQELIALGLCNIIGSFAASMPITGSFTRTALNYASGVQTQAGGVTKCILLIFALSFMTSTFYYIPKASLAGLILTAMFSMIDYAIVGRLWKSSKKELFLLLITKGVCLYFGLEYGILIGIALEALMLLYVNSRPKFDVKLVKTDKGDIIVLPMCNSVSYCAAEHVRKVLIKATRYAVGDTLVVIDGSNLQNMDSTVASNLISVVNELKLRLLKVKFLNFDSNSKNKCLSVDPKLQCDFVNAANVADLIEDCPKDV